MIRKFDEFVNEDADEDYSDLIGEEIPKITYAQAFEKYFIGKKIKGEAYEYPFNDNGYGWGIETEDGYKILYYGGGCSGEDCNSSFIISPSGRLIASVNQ